MADKADNRTRNWVCVGYPESLPTDWRETLSSAGVPAILSPLHDKDINPDGTPKKPHYHLIIMFAGKKSFGQVERFISTFGFVLPQVCENAQGYARYLIHKDNPEKVQYAAEEVVCFGGADWYGLVMTSADRYRVIQEVISFLKQEKMAYYHDLVDWCAAHNPEWFHVVVDNTIIFKAYCLSVATKLKDRNAASATPDFKATMQEIVQYGHSDIPPDDIPF